MNKIKWGGFAFLVIAVILLSVILNKTAKENNRLTGNQNSLLTATKFYKTSDSLNVASVEKLTLTTSEFKKYNADLVKTVESLNLKVRQLQSVSQTATQTDYNFKAPIHESLIYIDKSRPPDTIRCIKFQDDWLKLAGCIQNKQFSGIIESKDTIVQVVHRVPHKFLFFKYGTKAIRQEVLSKNPHTTVVFTEYIEFKR